MIECDDCKYRLWPVWCHAAKTGSVRVCELIHGHGRTDYAELVDRLTLAPAASTSDQFADPNKMVPPPNPWRTAILAMRACPHHVRPACGCDGGDCARPDKAGPTNLARCAECLGTPLPDLRHPDPTDKALAEPIRTI